MKVAAKVAAQDMDRINIIYSTSIIFGGMPSIIEIGRTLFFNIALVKSALGLFIVAVFDTNPRTLIIGRIPDNADPYIDEKIVILAYTHRKSKSKKALESLLEFMKNNNIKYIKLWV